MGISTTPATKPSTNPATTTSSLPTTTGLDDLLCSGREPQSPDNTFACQWNNNFFIREIKLPSDATVDACKQECQTGCEYFTYLKVRGRVSCYLLSDCNPVPFDDCPPLDCTSKTE